MILNVIIYDNGTVVSTTDKGARSKEYSGTLPILHKILDDYAGVYKVPKEVRDFFPTVIRARFANTTSLSSGNNNIILSEIIQIAALKDFVNFIKRK